MTACRAPRVFVVAAALAIAVACGVSAPSPAPGVADFRFDEATVGSLQEQMASGELTSREIVQAYLNRIEAVDRAGPTLRSVIETNPEALEIADSLDAERQAGSVRGPLHGIPVLVKDNIDTADQMMTTAGSLALEGPAPARDAFIIERLREAGVVILGKANLSEWANFRSTQSTSGWSGRGGLVRNPYALDRNTCGSSSGTGAAIAANLATIGIGTETDGSVVCPSSANGLVGIKPTIGLVSRAGIVPIAHSQDTAGPMARTVTDAALLLSAMAGADPRDPATAAGEGRLPADLTAGLDPSALQGTRIGVLRGPYAGYSASADRVFDEAVDRLRALGADPIEVEMPTAGSLGDGELDVLLYEFKADLNTYLATRQGLQVQTLADIIAFNEANRDREMPHFGQELMLMAQAKGPLTEPAYLEALETGRRLAGPEGIDQVIAEHSLDALVALTLSPAWKTDLINGDNYLGSSSTPAAVAGYPSITVPAGFVSGLPVGMSFIGTAWSEPVLIRLAYAFEQNTRHRQPPTFAPGVAVGR